MPSILPLLTKHTRLGHASNIASLTFLSDLLITGYIKFKKDHIRTSQEKLLISYIHELVPLPVPVCKFCSKEDHPHPLFAPEGQCRSHRLHHKSQHPTAPAANTQTQIFLNYL